MFLDVDLDETRLLGDPLTLVLTSSLVFDYLWSGFIIILYPTLFKGLKLDNAIEVL